MEAELRRGPCGGSDVAGTPTQSPRKLSKRGASTLRYAQNRTHISCSAAAWGVRGGDRLSMVGAKEEGVTHYRVAPSGRRMSFPEFYCTAKATGNIYEFLIKVITFYNITHIILRRLRV